MGYDTTPTAGGSPLLKAATSVPTGSSCRELQMIRGRPVASIFSRARSCSRETLRTAAGKMRPSASRHEIAPYSSLAFVSTQPSSETIVPKARRLASPSTSQTMGGMASMALRIAVAAGLASNRTGSHSAGPLTNRPQSVPKASAPP